MIIDKLKERQMENLIEGIKCLYRYNIYSTIDSSLATDGKIDKIIKDLEQIVREEYED